MHLCLRRGRDLERGCQRCRRLFPTCPSPIFPADLGTISSRFSTTLLLFQSEALLDPAEAEFNLISCNGDYALNVCSMGLMPALAQRPPGISTSLVTGPGAYGLSALANIIKGVHRPYRIALNGEVLEGEFTPIFADNGRWYGSGFHPAPDATPVTGSLDVLLVQPVSRLQVAIIIGKYKRGLYANYPNSFVTYVPATWKSNVPPLQKSI